MSGVPILIPNLPSVTIDGADIAPVWDTSAGLTGRFNLSNLSALYLAIAGGTLTGTLNVQGNVMTFSGDNGAGSGRVVAAARNNNAAPCPGVLNFRRATGDNDHTSVWPDDAGILRIANSLSISNGNYATLGSVLGTQTSSLDAKELLSEEPPPIDEVLGYIAEGAAGVRPFVYKAVKNEVYDDNGLPTGEYEDGPRPYGGEEFCGVIVDYAGRYGTDRDEAHPNGRSLNSINAVGDLLVAVGWLVEQNADLAARVAALEAA